MERTRIPLRIVKTFCALALLCTAWSGSLQAAAPTLDRAGGFRLMSRDGADRATPDDVVVAVPWSQVDLVTRLGESEPILPTARQLVLGVERELRKRVPADQTDAQREARFDTIKQELKTGLEKMVGNPTRLQFRVIDVVEAVEPKRPQSFNSADQRRRYQAALERYRRGKYRVIGELAWESPVAMSVSERRAVSRINLRYRKDVAAIAKAGKPNISPPLTDAQFAERKKQQKLDATKVRDNFLNQVRNTAARRRPIQMLYLLTNDENAVKWKRDTVRTAVAVIQSGGAYVYNYEKNEYSLGRRYSLNPHFYTVKNNEGEVTNVGLEFIARAVASDE